MRESLCPLHDPVYRGPEGDLSAAEVIARLHDMLTQARRARIARVVAGRTYTVTPVLDGLYDRGNVSAVLRSAEGLGYQAVHIVDSSEQHREAKRVTQGAEKWLDIAVWNEPASCAAHLKGLGYRILATCFEDAVPLESVDFTLPTALVFGNERDGVSDAMLSCADGRVVIPMAGFSQSFNISVAAALCLYHAARHRIERLGRQGDLNEEEQRLLTASFYLRSTACPPPPLDAGVLTQK